MRGGTLMKSRKMPYESGSPNIELQGDEAMAIPRARTHLLDVLNCDAQAALIAGVQDVSPVRGLTHGYYKYPARFSPMFVRSALQALTRPGDWVLDNHVGGGTTLVEALALGRNAIGVDISTLAEFVASAKTMVLEPSEIEALRRWANQLPTAISAHRPSVRLADYDELGYYRHLNHPRRWRIRKAIEQAIKSALQLASPRLVAFGRCAVLRTSQWALDGRKTLPSLDQFRSALAETTKEMIDAAREFAAAVKAHRRIPAVLVLNRSASGLEDDPRMEGQRAPKLVLTSPPYPGLHVLYHRWQVDGRKEAPLPFMIAGKLDGAGSSYYTMGDRKYPQLKTYFDNVRATMGSVAALADDETIVLQLLAFADATWQLPRYLETMTEAGLTEMFLPILRRRGDGRLWRTVPGRRWYSDQRGHTPGSAEVLLIHRKSTRVHY
jgi:hypothetical protein